MKSEEKALAHLQKAMEYIELGFGSQGDKLKPSRKSTRSKGVSMSGSAKAIRIIESHEQGYCMMKYVKDVAEDEEITGYFKPKRIKNKVQTRQIKEQVTRRKKDGGYLCGKLAKMYLDTSIKETEMKKQGNKELEALFSYDLNKSDLIYVDPDGGGFCICKKVTNEVIAKENYLPWNAKTCPKGYLYLALICMDKPWPRFTRTLGSIYLGKGKDDKGKDSPVCGIVDLIAIHQGFDHVLLASVLDKVNMYAAMGYKLVSSENLKDVI